MSYRVTDTQQVSEMTRAGTTKTHYRVWLVTEKGAQGYIDVSAEDWNADTLRDILSEFADNLDLAFTLSG